MPRRPALRASRRPAPRPPVAGGPFVLAVLVALAGAVALAALVRPAGAQTLADVTRAAESFAEAESEAAVQEALGGLRQEFVAFQAVYRDSVSTLRAEVARAQRAVATTQFQRDAYRDTLGAVRGDLEASRLALSSANARADQEASRADRAERSLAAIDSVLQSFASAVRLISEPADWQPWASAYDQLAVFHLDARAAVLRRETGGDGPAAP